MLSNGITIRKNTDVTKIKVKNNEATGIITSIGEEIEADAVICNESSNCI